jgi:hypothetical protein
LLHHNHACTESDKGEGAGSKLDNARELRKVVYFSNIVLAPLVAATKGGSAEEKKEKALQEMASLMAEARKKEEEAAAAEPEGIPPLATDPTSHLILSNLATLLRPRPRPAQCSSISFLGFVEKVTQVAVRLRTYCYVIHWRDVLQGIVWIRWRQWTEKCMILSRAPKRQRPRPRKLLRKALQTAHCRRPWQRRSAQRRRERAVATR